MTRTALFVWELGDGLGHVNRLLRIAERLRAERVDCRFVVRNIETAGREVRSHGFEILQAPIATIEPIRGPDTTSPVTSGDILGSVGFGRIERLGPLVDAWATLFDLVRPDLVVSDYSPTAGMALYGGRIPNLVIGDGFTLPPVELPELPAFRPGRPAFPDQTILDVMRALQERRGRRAPDRVAAIFGGDRQFVVTLPELDVWSEHRATSAVGPIGITHQPARAVPDGTYFAYLSAQYPPTGEVLKGLRLGGFEGIVYLRDSQSAQRDHLRRNGFDVRDTPVDLAEAAERASVIIHHGGIGTCEAAMYLGRPQLLVPRHFEHTTNARRLGRLGIAYSMRSAGKFRPEDVVTAMTGLASDPGPARSADGVARALASRPADALNRVVAASLELLGS